MEEIELTGKNPVGVNSSKKLVWGGILVALILGGISGWGLSRFVGSPTEETRATQKDIQEGQQIKIGQKYGLDDDVFKDVAEGILEKDGQSGEGTHKLLREGGESQTVVLTSSVLDLDIFVGHKVKVWGQTFASKKVGWLMDVGRLQVLE